ncbi:MAG: PilW family protein [Candidatus Binatia bacterium]
MTARREVPLRSSSGFTITELLIAMIVSLVVSLAGWGFYRTQLRVLTDQAAELEATESARAAIGFMAREIRHTGYDPLDSAFPDPAAPALPNPGALVVAQQNAIAFRWDNDGDGTMEANATDPLPESVSYAYNAGTGQIVRTVNGVSQTLISNIPAGGLVFQYFNRNGAPLTLSGNPAALTGAQMDTVAFVRVHVRVQADGTRTTPAIVEMSARAALRNRILDRL